MTAASCLVSCLTVPTGTGTVLIPLVPAPTGCKAAFSTMFRVAALTARRLVGTSSRILHSRAATGTGPLGLTRTSYEHRTSISPVAGFCCSWTVQEPSKAEKNWLSAHLKWILRAFEVDAER